MASSLVILMVLLLIHAIHTLQYVGEYPYHNLVSFLKGKTSCNLTWKKMKRQLEADSQNPSETNCLFFLEPPRTIKWEEDFRITKVNVTSHSYNYEYNFDVEGYDCNSYHWSQDVQSLLMCKWGKVFVGKTCAEGLGCDEERESCQEHPMFKKKFCIRRRHLDDMCETDKQCTGSRDAGACAGHICTCNGGFHRINKECVKVGRKLFESCERDIQCNGTDGAGTCKAFGNTSTCFCDDDKIQYGGKCLKGRRHLDDTCETDKQCTGTRDAGLCGDHFCTCNGGFHKVNKECVKVGRKLFESCGRDIQCNGTDGAETCKAFGNISICFCDDEKIQHGGKCLEGQRNLDDTCETDQQCTGTRHAGVCEDHICTCNGGFDKVNNECVKDTPQSWIHDSENQLILVGSGGFIFGIICSFVPLLFICCRKQKSRPSSSSRHAPSTKIYQSNQNTSANQDELSNARGNQIVHNIDENETQPIYNELNESAEQVPNNVYDVTHAMFSVGSSDDAVYSYNHLHEKESQLCANIYDVSHTSGSFKNGKDKIADNMADPSKESKE